MCCCVRCGAVQYMRADFVSWASLSGQNTQKDRRHPRNVLQRPLSSSEASSPVGRAVPSLSRLCCNSPVDSVLPRCRAGGVPLGPSRLSRRGLRLPQIALAAALSSLEGPPSPSPKPNDRPDPSALTTHSPLSRLTSPPLLAHIPPFLHSSIPRASSPPGPSPYHLHVQLIAYRDLLQQTSILPSLSARLIRSPTPSFPTDGPAGKGDLDPRPPCQNPSTTRRARRPS